MHVLNEDGLSVKVGEATSSFQYPDWSRILIELPDGVYLIDIKIHLFGRAYWPASFALDDFWIMPCDKLSKFIIT